MASLFKSPALVLVVCGLLALAFFIVSDPQLGFGLRMDGRELGNVIDAANDARWATITGIAGSAFVVVLGIWLLMRRGPARV